MRLWIAAVGGGDFVDGEKPLVDNWLIYSEVHGARNALAFQMAADTGGHHRRQ